MGSWVRCKCDELVHKNWFCGTGVSLVASEDALDLPDGNAMSAHQLVDKLFAESDMLLRCWNCSRIILLNERGGEFVVKFFAPEED